jgi:putative membrane protein
MEPAIAYLHFVSVLSVGAFLVTELFLCTRDLQPPHVRTLALVDLYYMIAAIVVLITGLLRVFVVGKGAGFYLQNPVFYIKVALFVAVGLVSILPTLQFTRWNRALKAGEERILRDNDIVTARRYVGLELVLLSFIPLMGVLMARGIGLQG